MNQSIGELNPPNRLMLTPGPSSMDPRVYRALATPLVGHVDPWFQGCMDDVQVLLRQIFQTENRITMPLSASGSGGIEASVVNTLEEGDEAIVAVNGTFSDRMAVIAGHTPAKVTKVEAPYGKAVDPEDVRRAGKGRKIKIVGFAHGETSSGVITDIDSFRKVADELGALLIVDTVASLAAVPINVDRQRIDICFSGTQKAISAPPGMSPITVSPQAEEVFRNRKTKVQSWYFDLTTAMNYWGKDRLYHHTPPISLIFALREAMRIVIEEGLENRWERHRINQLALIAGLEAMGLELLVKESRGPLADRHRRHDSQRHRRRKSAQPAPRRIQHRNRRRPGPAQSQNLARGPDGSLQPEAIRTTVPGRPGKNTDRPRLPPSKRRRRRRRNSELHPRRYSSRRKPLKPIRDDCDNGCRQVFWGSELQLRHKVRGLKGFSP